MKKILLVFVVALVFTSCYSYSYDVGGGAQTGVEKEGSRIFLLSGLIDLGGDDPTSLAGDATDYTVKEEHSIIDVLLRTLTGGLYSPISITVIR